MYDLDRIRNRASDGGPASFVRGNQGNGSQSASMGQQKPPGQADVAAPFQTPSISLPKGGGALKSIDEKFTVNAVNGTGALTIPLPFSHTRSGLDGGASLSYNSGSGNGVFGLGWSLSLPSIQRRTDKGLPRYRDDEDSDVFVLAGAEDLVPGYLKAEDGTWQPDLVQLGSATAERYRPRIEGAFARIQRITVNGEVGCYWKVTTADNVATIYGRTATARVSDPNDPDHVFRWLPEWSWDDKGNCVEFVWTPEDLASVPNVLEERNRLNGLANSTNRYLKRVRYGNKRPYYADRSTVCFRQGCVSKY